MSAAVKALRKVAKGAQKVVESVGHVVERTVEVAGAAVESTAKAVNNYVVKPIQKDPIQFVATAAGAYFGGPMGAFAANTAVNKAEGKSWGDSLKSGAMAGATTWGGQYGALEAGAANAAVAKAEGKSWEDALKSGAAAGITTGALNAAKVGPGGANPSEPAPIVEGLTPTSPSLDLGAQSGTSGAQVNAVPLGSVELNAPTVPDLTEGLTGDQLAKAYNDPTMANNQGPSVYKAPTSATPESSNAITPESPYRSSVDEPMSIDQQIASGDEVAGLKSEQGSAKSEIPIEEGLNNSLANDPRMYTGDDTSLNLGHAVDAASTVGDWVWDGAKWVWDHPGYAIAGGLLAQKYLSKPGSPPPGSQDTKDKVDQNLANNGFNTPLQQLTLDRQQLSTGFDRNANPYESGLYNYAEKSPEHQFFTPDIYTPVKYAMGGSVAEAQSGGYFNPTLGALTSQSSPSYYRYGSQPQNFNTGGGALSGYAHGGNVHDGRSDNIPAMLSQGEYVVDAETVGLLGNGSSDAGAAKLDQMRKQIRQQKGKSLSKGQFSPNAQSPLSYIKQRG